MPEVNVVKGKSRSVVEIDASCTIADLLERIAINRETVLVRLNGEVAIEEEALKDGDVVEIISAISGG